MRAGLCRTGGSRGATGVRVGGGGDSFRLWLLVTGKVWQWGKVEDKVVSYVWWLP